MKKLILIVILCIALIFSLVSCEINKKSESAIELKTIDEHNSELNYFFNLLEHEAKVNDKINFSINYQEEHYFYKESGEYDGEYWLSPGLRIYVGLNYLRAHSEAWYKECPDKEFYTINNAFFNEYCTEEFEGEVTIYGIDSLVGLSYNHTEETISDAIKSSSKDYLILKQLAKLPFVSSISISYSYSMPGDFFTL